ncbi:MAG: HlyC/CorC family transporter [Pontiellaceae bacterium]|nr:HlyC/CorC family transporter [Pontiellaceae bacterium]
MQFVISHIPSILSMALLLWCSAFFSGTESALFSLSRSQIRRLRGEGHRIEHVLSLLSGNPSGLLVAILFGNLVVNILFFSISSVLSLEIAANWGDGWQAASGVLVLLAVILFGEILPKAVGISFPERVARLNAWPLLAWFHFMGPVRRALEAVSRRMEASEDHDHRISAEELKMLIEATHHDPSFGTQEKAIVEDIVNLPEIRVRELMVPRVHQLLCRADDRAGEVLAEAVEQELELVPVYEDEEDNIIGVVEVCDLFVDGEPDRPLSHFVQPVRFVPEAKRADQMLQEFMAEGLRMVCVVDEYGGLAGTVCLSDLLEEVVGEFDVMEATPLVEQLGEASYRLQGSLGIREWRSLFVGFIPREMVQGLALDTVSGLVVSLLKHLPRVGDVAQVGNLRFTVEQVRSNRIELVRLDLVSELDGGAA